MLQKGDGIFVSLEVFGSLSWLKISNTGMRRTCRIYIVRIIIYNMRVIRKNGIFDAFCAICAFFIGSIVLLYYRGKKCVQSGYFSQRVGNAIFYKPLRVFCFSSLSSVFVYISLFSFFSYSIVFFAFSFFVFFVFVFFSLHCLLLCSWLPI